MLPRVATFRCLHSRNLSFSRAPHWRLSGFEAVSRLSFRRVYRALYDFLWESGDFNAKTPVPSLSYWLLSSFTLQFHHFSKRHGSSQRGWGQKWPGKIQVKNYSNFYDDRSFSNLTSFFCREIVDSKCYSLTYEFVCQLLQPVCFHEKMILPCQDFCHEFMNSCANVLPGELRDRIKCSVLATEADGPGACISKPGDVLISLSANRNRIKNGAEWVSLFGNSHENCHDCSVVVRSISLFAQDK